MATIIITGAGRGIGFELTKQYLERGDAVIATYRGEEGRARLSALGRCGALVTAKLDVRDPSQVEALVNTVSARSVDVLVNNAGVMGPPEQHVDTMDYEAWADVLAVNLLGPFRLSTAILPSLCRSAHPRIVTLSSIMGCLSRTSSGFYAYRSSKAAVNKVMKLLANDLQHRGVIVCPVHPGWVVLLGAAAPKGPSDLASGRSRRVPPRHRGTGRSGRGHRQGRDGRNPDPHLLWTSWAPRPIRCPDTFRAASPAVRTIRLSQPLARTRWRAVARRVHADRARRPAH